MTTPLVYVPARTWWRPPHPVTRAQSEQLCRVGMHYMRRTGGPVRVSPPRKSGDVGLFLSDTWERAETAPHIAEALERMRSRAVDQVLGEARDGAPVALVP